MPDSDFFTRLGFYVIKGFFDGESCATFRSEMRSSTFTPATLVEGYTSVEKVKQSVRKTKQADVSALTTSRVEERVIALKPMLESHFNLALAGCEKPQFLVYDKGDYFLPHKDGENEPGKPDYIKKRLLSIIIFLNKEAEEPAPECYCGGSLIFYGLIDDPRWDKYGFNLISRVGLLVAFRSDTLHEVTPVRHGDRYTIVSWFF